MSENNIKKAFDETELSAEAEDRMLRNILQKAAQSAPDASTTKERDNVTQFPTEKTAKKVPQWRRWGSVAACLVLVAAAGMLLPRLLPNDSGIEGDDPPVLGGSPVEDVTGAQDFEKLGFTIDAPQGAEEASYCIFDDEIARVDFTWNGHGYIYEAAKLAGNFSRAEGEAVSSTVLNAEYGAVLERLSDGSWRAHWDRDGVSCYLTNFDGAAEEDISAAAAALIAQG